MNIRDLRYVVAVAELQHFGQAAEHCHVSQPTLSGQIKKLEELLGIQLFERTNRRVVPTDACNDILISARRILREVENITDIADSSHDPLAGKFRLGAFPTLAAYVFPELVQKVKAAMPDLRLILIEEKTDQLIDKLKCGEIDAALLALPVEDDFLLSQTLFEDEFFLAVPPHHEFASLSTVHQDMLSSHCLLLLEEGHCLRDQALEVCKLHNIGEEQDFRATSMETLREMVKAGTGITFIPKIAIHEGEVGIHYIPFEAPIPTRTIGLVWRKTTARAQVVNRLTEIFTAS